MFEKDKLKNESIFRDMKRIHICLSIFYNNIADNNNSKIDFKLRIHGQQLKFFLSESLKNFWAN